MSKQTNRQNSVFDTHCSFLKMKNNVDDQRTNNEHSSFSHHLYPVDVRECCYFVSSSALRSFKSNIILVLIFFSFSFFYFCSSWYHHHQQQQQQDQSTFGPIFLFFSDSLFIIYTYILHSVRNWFSLLDLDFEPSWNESILVIDCEWRRNEDVKIHECHRK